MRCLEIKERWLLTHLRWRISLYRNSFFVETDHDVWKAVIYALDSGDETAFPPLPVPFSQFFLSPDGILCRFWPSMRHLVEQYVIPETWVPAVLHLAQDAIVACHTGRESTLSALRTHYCWPTIKIDAKKHVDRCVNVHNTKGYLRGLLRYCNILHPFVPFDCAKIDLLQLPPSYEGSKYIVVMVGIF